MYIFKYNEQSLLKIYQPWCIVIHSSCQHLFYLTSVCRFRNFALLQHKNNNMKKFILILCFLIIGGITFSQNVNSTSNETEISDEVNHVIHTDIGSIIFEAFYSINYEVTLKQNPEKSILRLRTGFIYAFDTEFYGVPLCLTALFGKSNRYFELTAGIAPIIINDYEKDGFGLSGLYNYSIYPLIDFGYRYEPTNGKLSYRIKIGTTGLGVGGGYAF